MGSDIRFQHLCWNWILTQTKIAPALSWTLSSGALGQLEYFHLLDLCSQKIKGRSRAPQASVTNGVGGQSKYFQIDNFNFLDFYLFEIQVVLPGPPVQCNKWSCEPISGQCSHCQACLLSSLPALPHHTVYHTLSLYPTPHSVSVPHTTKCTTHHTHCHDVRLLVFSTTHQYTINFRGLCGFQCDDVWYEVCFVRCNKLNKHRLQIGLHRACCRVSCRVLLY